MDPLTIAQLVLECRFEMDRRPRLRPVSKPARSCAQQLRSCRAERPGDPDRATPAGLRPELRGHAESARGRKYMSKFQSFAFVASVVGAALMTGAASAQTAAPAAMRPRLPWPTCRRLRPLSRRRKRSCKRSQKKAQKKVTSSVVVVVTNSRSVALSELDATPSGETLPKTIVSNLAPGQKISVMVATVKSCVFNLHGAYADGSNTDSTSVDLCKDKNVNLVE